MATRKLSVRTHRRRGAWERTRGWGFPLDALVGAESEREGDDVKSRKMEAGPFDVIEKQITTTSAGSSKVPARCKPVAL